MRTFTALVNPISGDRTAEQTWSPIADLLRARGAQVATELTRSTQHTVEHATTAARRGDVVVAVGGDGLARAAAEGVVAADGTLGIVAAGRGNDLVRHLDLPTDPAGTAELLLAGTSRRIDVLEAAGHVVLGNVYVGLDSVAGQIINDSRWLPGKLAYRLAPARALLSWRSTTFTVDVDGERRSAAGFGVVVANSGDYGHGLRMVPSAVVDDGRIDVLAIGAGPRRNLPAVMSEAKTGAHVRRPQFQVRTGREVVLDADRPIPVHADGDYLTELPVTVRIRPAALSVLTPTQRPFPRE